MKKWLISESQYSSPFIQETRRFGRRDSIYLVDQYAGKLPVLLDGNMRTSLVGKDVRPSALFDSNIMDMINKRVAGCRCPSVERLLYFMTANQWDFIPDFYLLEHYCKTLETDHVSNDSFANNAKKRLSNWLEVYAMDQGLFLKNYVIKRSSEAEEFYCSRFKVSKLVDIVDCKIENLIASVDYIGEVKRVVNISKILIYKTILLHLVEARGEAPIRKLQEFEIFQKETLGIGMPREFFLAMLYFNNSAGKLLGVQANTSSEKTHEIVSSTAWDLLFLRIPEFKFSKTTEPYVIPYIVTKEKRLAHFAGLTWYREIGLDGWRGYPENELDLESLPRKFTEELRRDFKRLPSNRSKRLDDEYLQEILEQLMFEIDKRLA